MDIAQIALFTVIIVLAILLLVLGVQVFFILREFRKTVFKANKVLDNTNIITESVSAPISSLSGITSGIKTGLSFLGLFKKLISKDEDSGKKRETIQMDNNKSNSNFPGGFLFGVLVGAAIMFLLGTKKGKNILKAISESGMDNLNNVLEKAGKGASLEEVYEEEDDDIVQETKFVARETVEEKPRVRRFFKGISKHLN